MREFKIRGNAFCQLLVINLYFDFDQMTWLVEKSLFLGGVFHCCLASFERVHVDNKTIKQKCDRGTELSVRNSKLCENMVKLKNVSPMLGTHTLG